MARVPALAACVLAALIHAVASAATPAAQTPPVPIDPSDPLARIAVPRVGGPSHITEMLLDVVLNAQPQPEPVMVLRPPDGRLRVPRVQFAAWRLRPPGQVESLQHLGQEFWPLDAVAGVTARIDEASQRLLVEAPPAAFEGSQLRVETVPPPVPQRGERGGYFNYELFLQHLRPASSATAASSQRGSEQAGLFEFGFFNAAGVGTMTLFARSGESLRRLETSWVRDEPERRSSLRVGDALTRAPGGWGSARRFAGVQYATNFGTQPYTATLPALSLSAEATLPSTVEVFVNNALVSSNNVTPGPFSVERVPAFAGAGEVRVVVRDLFGREQVLARPFYASLALLRAGIDDYSFEAGALRSNYAQPDDRYGKGFAAGTLRRGLTDQLTVQAHVHTVSSGPTVLAAHGAWLVGTLGAMQADVALSSGGGANGNLLGVAFERQGSGTWGYGAQGQFASARFRHLGLEDGQRTPRQLMSAYGSWFGGPRGSASLAYIHSKDTVQGTLGLLSGTYTLRVGRESQLLVTALRSLRGESVQSFQVAVSTPFGDRRHGSAGLQNQGGARSKTVLNLQAQQSLPAGTGWGWRVAVEGSDRQDASVSWQNDRVTADAEVSGVNGAVATRLSAGGGMAWLDGRTYHGRRLGNSFAVVRLPDHPGVRIFVDNQPVARTDEHGNAFLPRLRPYERNQIGIDPSEFPLDIQIDALRINATPYARHGLVIDYPARRIAAALVRVRLDDGQPAPTGAVLRLSGQETEYPIAFDGEAYVTGLRPTQRASLEWKGQRCEWDLAFERGADPLPRLGPYVCAGVRP